MGVITWLENNEGMDKFCGSPLWNTTLTWHSDEPDFTKCFEKTFLVWIPCVFICIFSPLELHYQKISNNKHIAWNWKNFAKLLINALICLVCVVDFFHGASGDVLAKVDILMPLCKLVSFGLAFTAAYRNKIYGIQSSAVLFLFWLFCAICGAPQFRTEIRSAQKDEIFDYYQYNSYLMYYPLVVAMLLLNCLAEGRPRIYPYGQTKKPSPEPESSFPTRITFTFFDKIMYKGWRRPLEMKDLWDIAPENKASSLVPVFQEKFDKNIQKSMRKYAANVPDDHKPLSEMGSSDAKNKNIKRKDTSIVPVLWRCVWPQLIMGISLRFITDVALFINPKLLGLIINHAGSDDPLWKGLTYAGMMFLVNALMTLLGSEQMNIFFKIGVRMKTILTSAIYRKALRISNAARRDKTVGEIVNLMAVDAVKFQELMGLVNTLWSAPLSIILAIYFLWQELGPAALTGVVVMVLLIPLNTLIVKKSKALQTKQMKDKDNRVKMMNEILSGMKVLKLYAWEESFQQIVMMIRNKEIFTLRKAAYLNAITNFVWTCAPFLVSFLTFMMYVLLDENNVLTPAKVFVSLSLMNLLRMPMILLPMVITNVAQLLVSVKRLNSFLNAEELVPYVTHDQSKAPIVIENGTFAWEEEPTLKDINIDVSKNDLTAVVGAVGSGKSSLVSAILGEMDKISGIVNTTGSIAYVPQQAWIQNATVRDNIIFGLEFDKNRYNKVIEACALKPDFEMLADGDQTEIGEKGINLSGGQKQRISLARAVYVDADVYLLDDPLSAVDSHVGKHIFDKLLGPEGLLKDKTRVLVTHAVTYLPQTRKIIVLNDGTITESGSYQELLEKKGAFAAFILQHIAEKIEDEEELEEINKQLEDTPIAAEVKQTITRHLSRLSESESIGSQHGLNGFARSASRESIRSNTSLARRKLSVSSRKMSLAKQSGRGEKNDKENKGKLIETEKAEQGTVKMQVYWYYLAAVGIIAITATVVLQVVSQSLGILINLWLGWWSEDSNMIVDDRVNTGLRDMYLGVYGGLGVLQSLVVLVGNMIFATGTMKAAKVLHNTVLHNVMRLPMSFFDTTPSGRILSRFSSDIMGVDYTLPMVFKMFFQTGTTVLGTLAVICYTTPIFTGIIIPIAVLYVFIQRYYVRTSRQLKRIESVSRSPIYSHFGETVSGTTVIRAYMQGERFTTESDQKIDINQKTLYATNCSVRWLSIRLEMIGNVIIFAAALLAVLGSGLDPALVGLSVSYSLNITINLNYLVRMISDVETTIVAVERIKEYSEIKQEADWEIPNQKPAVIWPEKGTVAFKKYGVRYRNGLELVLKGISFHVNGGEKVGIVGRTGAGKSSLTLSLFRIIESAQGEIQIDGKNIADMGLHDLRSRLTIIPQDAVLFSGTLRLNLDPFDKYSDEEVWKALELAYLKDYVKGLPAGLHHKVSEGGDNLSTGQRQLICLARALLRKTKILILDEATAAVDLETDDLIQKTIRTAFADCTVLTIAHRLNTIIDSDRVLVLDKGQIAEFNTPASLLDNKDSIFFGMCKDAGLAS